MGRGNRSNAAEAAAALQLMKGNRQQGQILGQGEHVAALLAEQNRLLARQNELLEWIAGSLHQRLPGGE